LGSELGLYYLLRKLGKQALIINEDPLPQEYSFLPGKENIGLYKPELKGIDASATLTINPERAKRVERIDFDCMVVLDCTDFGRIGLVQEINKNNKPVINIDHHISNRMFGCVNWVEPHMSSASEMIFNLYKEMRVPFDKDAAMDLYTGILTDSGSFRYSNTSSLTHRAAAELLRFNIEANQVYRNIYENIPFSNIQVLIRALAHIHRTAGGRIAWVGVPARIFRHKTLSFDLTDHILGFIRAIRDIQVAVLFKENLGVKNEIRVNFRSTGLVDVNKIAQGFGGGGHKTAAGCTVAGKLTDVRKKVIAKIRRNLK